MFWYEADEETAAPKPAVWKNVEKRFPTFPFFHAHIYMRGNGKCRKIGCGKTRDIGNGGRRVYHHENAFGGTEAAGET